MKERHLKQHTNVKPQQSSTHPPSKGSRDTAGAVADYKKLDALTSHLQGSDIKMAKVTRKYYDAYFQPSLKRA